MIEILKTIVDYVWGLPLIILLLGTGIYLTILLKGLQFRQLFSSLYLALIKRKDSAQDEGDISHFQALMTALAATVGTGNIAGVAAAITAGGPGALFWMWITGFFGMATKYAEAVLAVKFRETDAQGNMSGGPMYYIDKGLSEKPIVKHLAKPLAVAFAVFASLAAFGIGNMVQANSIADGVYATFKIPHWGTAIFLVIITGLVIMGGIKNIGRATSAIVPVMVVFYMIGAIVILIINYDKILGAFSLIFHHAFNPSAAAGGFLGQTIRVGVARGIFSNESGLGSSPIAAAAAKTKEPVRQALVSMTQTFIDTIIVCTLTGLVILITGVWTIGKTAGIKGAALTEQAFSTGMPGEWGGIIVTIGLVFFAYSTILGWSYYGERAMEYLFGDISIVPYRVLWIVGVLGGTMIELEAVWKISDIMNGLMAFPNLIALLLLSGVVAAETKKYFDKMKS